MPDERIWDADELKEPVPLPDPDGGEPPSTEELLGDDEIPPDPSFLIIRNAYGPGAHSVKFPDGTPVGVWARDTGLSGELVEAKLLALGLDADLAADFRRRRDGGVEAENELMRNSAVRGFAQAEAHHSESMEFFRSEFLKAQAKKAKEGK